MTDGVMAAALETLERECIDMDGDWRSGPPWIVFDREKAKTILAAAFAPWLREELRELASVAGGMTGPGNTPDQCQGYSDACRDIKAAIVKRLRELE